MDSERKGPGLLSLSLLLGIAFISVELYNAGVRDGKLTVSELPDDNSETDSPPKSQPEKEE